MPIAKVQLPDGRIAKFEVPEGTSQEQVMQQVQSMPEFRSAALQGARQAGDREAFGELMQQGIERKDPTPIGGDAADPLRPIVQGATFGFSDELAGAMGAIPTALATGQSVPQAYQNVRDYERAQLARIQQESPYLSMAGEIAGSIPTGVGALNMARQAAPNLARGVSEFAGKNIATRLGTTAGLGAVSGSVYGAGTGGTDETSRLEGAAQGGVFGGLGGAVGAGLGVAAPKVGRGLAERARKLFSKQETVTPKTTQELVEMGDTLPTEGAPLQSRSYGKIDKALREDFGDDYESVINALRQGDTTLAELYGGQTRGLAKGAAQYPSGLPRAKEYFDQRVAEEPFKLAESIKKNVTGGKAYYATLDDVVDAGRAEAKPIYDKAYAGKIKDTAPLQTPEVQDALERAYKLYPSQLQDAAPDSIKALDYAKRVLDDDIGKAMRSGEGNLARARIEVKDNLLKAMDEASPDYAKARAASGDYLKIKQAMDSGKNFLKEDYELVPEQFAKLGAKEKEAYRIGVGKALLDKVNNSQNVITAVNSIVKPKAVQSKLAKIMNPTQLKNLNADLKATGRLVELKQEIVGGSPTISKGVAKDMLDAGGAALDVASGGITAIPRQAAISFTRKWFDGLNDKTAKEVTNILFEDRPAEKLKIINNLAGKRYLTDAERETVKRAYFEAEEAIKTLRAEGAIIGGAAANITEEE